VQPHNILKATVTLAVIVTSVVIDQELAEEEPHQEAFQLKLAQEMFVVQQSQDVLQEATLKDIKEFIVTLLHAKEEQLLDPQQDPYPKYKFFQQLVKYSDPPLFHSLPSIPQTDVVQQLWLCALVESGQFPIEMPMVVQNTDVPHQQKHWLVENKIY